MPPVSVVVLTEMLQTVDTKRNEAHARHRNTHPLFLCTSAPELCTLVNKFTLPGYLCGIVPVCVFQCVCAFWSRAHAHSYTPFRVNVYLQRNPGTLCVPVCWMVCLCALWCCIFITCAGTERHDFWTTTFLNTFFHSHLRASLSHSISLLHTNGVQTPTRSVRRCSPACESIDENEFTTPMLNEPVYGCVTCGAVCYTIYMFWLFANGLNNRAHI